MTTNFVQKGTEIIKQAVMADNNEKWEEALSLYAQGIQYLITALKYEKNKRVTQALKEKVGKYITRAEEIKESITQPKKKTMKASAGGGGGGDNSSDEKDDETTKLQNALSQAIVIEKPNVKWSDVAGLDTAKALLKEAVILPIQFPQLFTGKRKPWAGILLYGPPGTGKSYLAKAVATEANNSTFFSVSSSDLVSKYVGESERLVKNLFTLAREKKPSIVFIDEIDSLGSKRGSDQRDNERRLKTEFLVQMQGVGKDTRGVLILGATNCPWDLDPALRRRFTKRIYIPLPDLEARTAMFKIHLGKDTPHQLTQEDFKILAGRTKGFSGSDISGVVQDALMEPIRVMQDATHFKKMPLPNGMSPNDYLLVPCSPGDPEGVEMTLMTIPDHERDKVGAPILAMEHFIRVLTGAKPSVGIEDLRRHQDWTREFGQEGV